MAILFDFMKQILKDAINDPEFVRKNSILADQVTQADLLARVDALKRSYDFELTEDDIASVEGEVVVNHAARWLDVAPGDPAPASNRAVFNAFNVTTTFRLHGWLHIGSVAATDMQVQWRRTATDAWHDLDSYCVPTPDLTGDAQVRVNFTTQAAPVALERLILLAEQV